LSSALSTPDRRAVRVGPRRVSTSHPAWIVRAPTALRYDFQRLAATIKLYNSNPPTAAPVPPPLPLLRHRTAVASSTLVARPTRPAPAPAYHAPAQQPKATGFIGKVLIIGNSHGVTCSCAISRLFPGRTHFPFECPLKQHAHRSMCPVPAGLLPGSASALPGTAMTSLPPHRPSGIPSRTP
jgi:hypothetical protein